jgi:mono/diheme cytochrome c family protein
MSQRGWATTGKLFFGLFVVLLVIISGALAFVIREGVSARGNPTATEAMLGRTMRHFAIPASARRLRNPLPLTPAALREGRDHFADHCAGCHANDGSGKTEVGESLYPKAPDMREAQTQQLSDGEILYIIRNGVRLTGMPGWGGEHDDDGNWKLVHFIRHLPKITSAEIEEMKRMNPISPHERQEQKEEEEFLEGAHKNESH